MNTSNIQQLKMAWLAAKEAGNAQEQMRLMQEHPTELSELSEFIAAYYASGSGTSIEQDEPLLPMAQRAYQRALDRVFPAFATLTELRKSRNLTKVAAAQRLRLSIDVWNKFEAGAIELSSLTQRQLDRFAQALQVSIDQFCNSLTNSQPEISFNRRQTRSAANNEQQGPQKQSFAEAIDRSSMSAKDKQYWLSEQEN